MRALAVLLAVLAPAAAARAQEVSGSGSLGAGIFGPQAVTSAEVGIDLSGSGFALGVGGRARFLAQDGFRGADWDELSEQARVIRYGTAAWTDGDPDGTALSAALGELGGVSLGHASIIDGYASGLDVDHGHLGAQARAQSGAVSGELVLDDLVAPRIGGMRVAAEAADDLFLAASVAGDRTAPTMEDPDGEVVAAAALDGELRAASDDDRVRAALYGDAVAIAGLAAGLHAGASGSAVLAGDVRFGARAELRAGTRHYLPGWIGPLYEIERREMRDASGAMESGQLDAADTGGLAGIGAAGALTVDAPEVASGEIGYTARRGVADVITARALAPFHDRVQAGLWTAAAVRGGVEALALAAEARVRLPDRMFLRADAARLVREGDAGLLRPVWLVELAVGASLGE